MSSAEFKGAQPIEVDAFKTWQAECTERGKAGLWTSWLPKCVEVFRRLLPIFINGNSDAYYSSIATLQVLSICSAMCCVVQVHVLHGNTPPEVHPACDMCQDVMQQVMGQASVVTC